MLKIAICDDEKKLLNIIVPEIKAAFFRQHTDVQITAYESAVRLREDLFGGTRFQLIFLDISMPDMNGIILAQHLKKVAPQTMILFLSSHEETVFDAFKAAPFRFIRKRTFRSEIDGIVLDILATLNEQEIVRILLADKKGQFSVNPYEIIFAEAASRTCSLTTVSGIIETRTTFSSLEKELEPYGFLKIHRSILVNYRYIHSIKGNELLLDDGRSLPISKYRLQATKQNFQKLMQTVPTK